MEELHEAKRIADALGSLLAHPGWAILSSYLRNLRAAALEELVATEDLDRIVRLQERVRVIDALFDEISALRDQGAVAEKLLRGEINA